MIQITTTSRRAMVLAAASFSVELIWAQERIGKKGVAAVKRDALNWPTRPIRLIVGFPPGSVQDISARALSEPLSKALGQPVLVENRAGASGVIAGDAVAKSKDEHTFGIMNNSQLTVAKILNPAAAYDPVQDLMPVALIGTTPMVLVVSSNATGATPQDWIQWLRNQGNKANYGTPGTGTPGHLGMELIKSRGAFEAVHVPYPGNPQVITAMLGGQLQAALLPPGLAMQQVRSGKMKAIGISAASRSSLAPELQTLRDVGITGVDMDLWTAMAAPASLPIAVRDKMMTTVIHLLKEQEIRTRLFNAGWQPTPSTAEGLASRIQKDKNLFGGIITIRGIKEGS